MYAAIFFLFKFGQTQAINCTSFRAKPHLTVAGMDRNDSDLVDAAMNTGENTFCGYQQTIQNLILLFT